ncbi:MAG: hypothetical protein JRG89_10780, partial [Deltaproteobacteria bacterium]|nr:hypothetical protein [Deltaproteobacteria bacterium]
MRLPPLHIGPQRSPSGPQRSRIGPPRKNARRKLNRPSAIAAGMIGLLLIASFGADLEANEMETVRRSGDVGQFEPIAIASLPTHRSINASNSSERKAVTSSELKAVIPSERKKNKSKHSGESFSMSSGVSVIDGKMSRGQSLSTLLRARGVSPQIVRTIDREIRSEFDLRKAQPGDA